MCYEIVTVDWKPSRVSKRSDIDGSQSLMTGETTVNRRTFLAYKWHNTKPVSKGNIVYWGHAKVEKEGKPTKYFHIYRNMDEWNRLIYIPVREEGLNEQA